MSEFSTSFLIDAQMPKDPIFPLFCKAEILPQRATCAYCRFHSFPLHNVYCLMVSMAKLLSAICLDHFLLVHAILKTFLKTKMPRSNLIYSFLLISYIFLQRTQYVTGYKQCTICVKCVLVLSYDKKNSV